MNETRYPEGTVEQSAIRFVAEFYDGRDFLPLPGAYQSLESALIALKQEDE